MERFSLENTTLLEDLLKFLFSNRYDKVMIENTKFYANVLGYPLEIVKKEAEKWKKNMVEALK